MMFRSVTSWIISVGCTQKPAAPDCCAVQWLKLHTAGHVALLPWMKCTALRLLGFEWVFDTWTLSGSCFQEEGRNNAASWFTHTWSAFVPMGHRRGGNCCIYFQLYSREGWRTTAVPTWERGKATISITPVYSLSVPPTDLPLLASQKSHWPLATAPCSSCFTPCSCPSSLNSANTNI